MYLTFSCFILLWGLDVSHAEDPCNSRWVEYIPGNMSLIFSVPHDGNDTSAQAKQKSCSECPDLAGEGEYFCKNNKGFFTDECPKDKIGKPLSRPDAGTREIALMMREHLIAKGGRAPHLVINKMHRVRMEPNSGREKGTRNMTEQLEAYDSLHGCIQQLVDTIPKPGLLLDIHGHKNHNNTLFGYRVMDYRWCTEDGQSQPSLLDVKGKSSSIKDLVKRNKDLTLSEVMIGTQSIGARLEKKGFYAIPSPRMPCPGDLRYYSGGKLVQWYSSGAWETKNKNAKMDGLQMEIPREIRLNKEECKENFGKYSKWSKDDCIFNGKIPEEEKKITFAKAIGDVLQEFFDTFYSSSFKEE